MIRLPARSATLLATLVLVAAPGARASLPALPALLDCAREASLTLLSAHRGGPRPGAPESSLAALEASIADGALFLEIDLAETRDGVLVLMHDRTVDRTTTGSGAVAALTLAELRALRLRDRDGRVVDAPPPTLAEALALAERRAVLQLDVKGVAPARLVRALRAADAVNRVLVITYTADAALEFHRLAPELVLSVGLDGMAEFERLEAAGLDADRLVAWLGLGDGDPALDRALAARGVETSYADFRAERGGGLDYAARAAAGAEILSVDEVAAASRALDARRRRGRLLASCGAAGPVR